MTSITPSVLICRGVRGGLYDVEVSRVPPYLDELKLVWPLYKEDVNRPLPTLVLTICGLCGAPYVPSFLGI